jgi:hypothetical protein
MKNVLSVSVYTLRLYGWFKEGGEHGVGVLTKEELRAKARRDLSRYFSDGDYDVIPVGRSGEIFKLGPSTSLESLLNRNTAALSLCVQGATRAAHATLPLGTRRRARSQVEPGLWRGRARYGRASQAFALVESGVVDRATANSSPQTAAGHKQGDQAAKTKPPAGSCSRILDQSLGSTRAHFSRNRPLE